MNQKQSESILFDFDIRYETEKPKDNPINTECILTKKNRQLHQLYTGLYFQKCYHNTGRYKWFDGDQEYVYEGKLYANDLHGYGRLVYPDHSSFEGLFFHNKRFGPGIVTYTNNLQDVGFWDGNYLIRLAQNVELEDFYLENIPNIGKTLEGKMYLLKFKEIVPLVDKNNPVANLVKKLNMKPELCEQLYSKCIRNYKSIFMNRASYDENFYTDPRELIVEIFDHLDENDEPVTNKVTATNLLAWNNEKKYIDIMKHTFMNRKYEKILSYKIRNAILPNRRDTFMAEGPIEEMSLKLLAACRDDDTLNITKLICDYDLYPNLSDCFGNTTIIYAAMANKREAIKTLVNLGANLNLVNDECVTALILCILNYIAIKNEALENNWEDSFLKLTSKAAISVDGRIWPTKSTSSSSENNDDEDDDVVSVDTKVTLSTRSSRSTCASTRSGRGRGRMKKKKVLENKLINKLYIFNLIYKAPVKETASKRLTNMRRKLRQSRMFRNTIKCDKNEALENVMKTIRVLIQCGIDINACEVPYPPLISTLFSDNVEMVQLLLENKVNVNKATTRESGGLNPLHIVCAMKKNANQEKIVNMLLDFGADVDARANMSHWPEARDKLLAGDPLEDEYGDMGKTPFHVLAMRYDFEDDAENVIVQVAKMLVKAGANPNEKYLEHNVLSLAVLRGNEALTEYLLSTGLVDPNGSLGNMGVPLTMLTLPKYSKSLMAFAKIDAMMELLVKYNANPFNQMENFDKNALEFAMANNDVKKENVGLSALFKVAASVLRRYIDGRALQMVFRHVRLSQNNPLIRNIVKYLTLEKAVNIIQILLDNKLIPPNFELCMKVLNFVQARVGKGKLQIEFIDKPGCEDTNNKDTNNKDKKPSFEMTKTLVQIKVKRKQYELDFNREDKEDINPYNQHMPEIDKNHAKYKVCYSCLLRENKNLQLCPSCNLVYFCSVKCNVKENEAGEHPCKKAAYESSAIFVSKSGRRLKKKSMLDTNIDLLNICEEEEEEEESSSDESTEEEETEGSKHKKIKKKGKKKRKKRRNRFRRRRRRWRRHKPRFVLTFGKKVCAADCKGTLVAIGFKEPLVEVIKKMRRKYRPPEYKQLRREVWSDKLKCKFPLNEKNIDLMLRTAKRVNLQLVPISDELINPCDPFDYKFWQLFLPYCVFQEGELFYRSNDCDILYRLPYKCK